MYYFAYGSNMDWSQMRGRCPSAKFVAVAQLRDYHLAFTRLSKNRNCGVSDVVPKQSESVWGVVYEIAENEISLLDKHEGFREGRETALNAYVREQRHVLQDGDTKRSLLAAVYVGNPQSNPPLPNNAYKDLLVNGAMHWKLPGDYINFLKKIKTLESPN